MVASELEKDNQVALITMSAVFVFSHLIVAGVFSTHVVYMLHQMLQ